MDFFHLSETGSVRRHNEDSYLLLPESGLFAVADGMGGHNAGEVASALAIETLRQAADALRGLTAAEALLWMESTFDEANRRILAAAEQEGQDGMGTTLTALALCGEQAVFGHIGDSRAYLFREGAAAQLTKDHSVVGDLLQNGVLTPEEASRHPARNVLSKALGAIPAAPDCFGRDIRAGDGLLLCTDGFSNLLKEDEMNGSLRSVANSGLFAGWKNIILERGAPDNFTAVLIFPRGRR
ncbi:MAG: protein phosphatase 2C domain-containing protein [Gracilibacteraceae bacterium]|jgi:protein phosphatase|nr:protein phosphatase 2C domain-containing protein [Gracilibacteraceae bacterium]